MDIERTKQYYAKLTEEDLCRCDYCRTYVREIRKALPRLAAYLERLGVNIEKPFEVLPLDETAEYMEYLAVQYVVIGSAEGFEENTLEGMDILITDSHPMTDIGEAHFVIEIVPHPPLRLKREAEQTAEKSEPVVHRRRLGVGCAVFLIAAVIFLFVVVRFLLSEYHYTVPAPHIIYTQSTAAPAPHCDEKQVCDLSRTTTYKYIGLLEQK